MFELSAVDENTCLNELEKTVNRYINKIQSCSEQKTPITTHAKTALLHGDISSFLHFR